MNKLNYYFEMVKKVRLPFIIPKAWNYLKYRIFRKLPIVKCYTPQIVSVMLINRCNLQCDYCGFVKDGLFKQPKHEMTLEIIKKIFSHKLCKNSLLVDLLGGEPLLCKDFIHIVKFLSTNGYLTNTSTNGLLLANHIKELKDAGITRINVSIYPENLEILKISLPRINKIYQVHTSYVLTKTILENNRQYISDIIDFAVGSGCKSLRFWMYRPLGIDKKSDEVIMGDSSAYKEFKAEIIEKYGKFILWPQVVVSDIQEKKCTQPWQRTNVAVDGSIALCCGDISNIENVNLFKSSFEEIFNCEQIMEIRSNLLNNSVPPLEVCKNCNLLTESGW